MFYSFKKQNDGTYNILFHKYAFSDGEIVKTGVRGCNVNKVIDSLYSKDLQKEGLV